MSEWLRLATRRHVVHRAVKYAVVVGTVLVAINHGEALARGEISMGRLFQMILTMSVPYFVSTASSVGALRDRIAAEPPRGETDA